MKQERAYMKKIANSEPACDQGLYNGHRITYNPDDGRFYVHERVDGYGDEPTRATFKHWNNAVHYARHTMKD